MRSSSKLVTKLRRQDQYVRCAVPGLPSLTFSVKSLDDTRLVVQLDVNGTPQVARPFRKDDSPEILTAWNAWHDRHVLSRAPVDSELRLILADRFMHTAFPDVLQNRHGPCSTLTR